MIVTVTSQGKMRWMIIDEAFDADRLIGLPEALIRDADRKVFLILDNAGPSQQAAQDVGTPSVPIRAGCSICPATRS